MRGRSVPGQVQASSSLPSVHGTSKYIMETRHCSLPAHVII